MLYVFGDSWGYGSELTGSEKPFANILSAWLNIDHKNFSQPGLSLGHITSLVLNELEDINEDDFVVVVIPPDVRWYSIDDNFRFRTLSLVDENHKDSIADLSLSWFIYHHNLFMYTICNALSTKTNKFILAHNYGKLIFLDSFNPIIDHSHFLSNHSLTDLLTGKTWEENYSLEYDGPTLDAFSGKYFEGKKWHPNQSGHVEIAKLLLKKFQTYQT